MPGYIRVDRFAARVCMYCSLPKQIIKNHFNRDFITFFGLIGDTDFVGYLHLIRSHFKI